MLGGAELALGVDLERDGIFQAFIALRAFRDVPHAHARQPLVLPGGAVIEREIKACVLQAAGLANGTRITRRLFHIHHGFEEFLLRVITYAADFFIEGIALDRQYGVERAVCKIAELIGVRGEQRTELDA